MQISMELMSQIVSRTGSGAGAKTDAKDNALTVSAAKPSFKKVLEDSRPVKEDPILTERGFDSINEGKDREMQQLPHKPDDEEDTDLAAAGAAVNQAAIVTILEGDMESTTVPEIFIDAAAESICCADTGIGSEPIQGPETDKAASDTEFAIAAEDARPEITASDVIAATLRTEEPDARGADVNAGNAGKADNAEPAGGSQIAGMTGEVMARTPTNRTSQQQGDDSEAPEYGDPGPLENENDTAPVKGHKGKTYADTIRETLDKNDNAPAGLSDVPPPLAEGLKPEQFRADQQMKRVAPDTHVNAENLFDEMVSRIETLQTDTKSAMTIQLKPEFLGKVALEIAVDAAGLHVKINAEDSSVRSMINGQINTLIESLENKGIAVVEVEVTYTGVNNGTFKDSGEGRAQPEQSRRSHHNREVDPVDGAAYYAALSFDALGYLLEEDVSSVEYRA